LSIGYQQWPCVLHHSATLLTCGYQRGTVSFSSRSSSCSSRSWRVIGASIKRREIRIHQAGCSWRLFSAVCPWCTADWLFPISIKGGTLWYLADGLSAWAACYSYLYLFDAHYTQFQWLYRIGSETIANMNNDTKASNESTNRHRIAIHYTGYIQGWCMRSFQ